MPAPAPSPTHPSLHTKLVRARIVELMLVMSFLTMGLRRHPRKSADDHPAEWANITPCSCASIEPILLKGHLTRGMETGGVCVCLVGLFGGEGV